MYSAKRLFSIIVALTMLIAIMPGVGLSVSADGGLVFGTPVFTRTLSGLNPEVVTELKSGTISVDIDATNSGSAKDAILVMALFRNGYLSQVAFDKETISSAATLSAEVEVAQSQLKESVLKVFVLNNIADMTLISDIHVLSGILEDKSINSFTVEIGGKTFEGIINPETKIITVDVPTRLTSNNDVRENNNLLSPAEFNAAKTAITPVITASPNAVVSGLGEAKDFTNPQEYTVTAPDGSTTTYTAIVEETIIKRSQNIQGASMIIPGQGSYGANRHSTPIGGTLGDGVWEQVGVVHEGTQIAENSPARIEMVADPENENLKVLRMNKTVSGQAFKLVSTGAFSNLPGITRFTTQVRMRFNDISAGDGFYMMLANRDNVIFRRNAAGTGFILRSRSAWNTAISDIPTKTKDFNFDQWYTFTFVNYNVNNGNGTFTNTMEVYVDGEFEAIRTSNHASDITFSARHMEFNCFANTLFDMYWSDMSITFKMQ